MNGQNRFLKLIIPFEFEHFEPDVLGAFERDMPVVRQRKRVICKFGDDLCRGIGCGFFFTVTEHSAEQPFLSQLLSPTDRLLAFAN